LLQGLLLPAGTPKSIFDWWHHELAKVVALPDVKERLAAIGVDPVVNRPEEFAAQIRAEISGWAKVIQDAGIRKIE
jgi:tripartite-type tricarboxylate transporter receptor subunit TctC